MQPYRTDEWSNVATNMANSVMGFGSFVDQLYRLQEQQYLFACLALESAAALDEKNLRTLAAAIMEQKRPTLLGKLLGHQVEENACQVLYKLGPSPHPATVYRAVLIAISVKPIGKALSHASTITPTVLLALSEFVAERLPVTLLHLLSSGHHTPLVDACISLARALPENNRADAIGALANARTPTAVGGWFDRWIRCLDFPTPPSTGNDTLRPIINFSELASDGYMMRHCIADYAEEIMAGTACVYHWSGAQQATILLRIDAAGLWHIEEMRGVDNQIIGELDQKVITEAVDTFLKNSSTVSGQGDCAPDKLWSMRALSRPFPPPPIDGTDLIVPILSAEDLLNAHKEMEIEFDNFWMLSVLSWKTAYFFQTRGGDPALVLTVLNDSDLFLVACLARRSQPVPMQYRREIHNSVMQAFAAAGYDTKRTVRE
jgi:hypothetical protein